MYIYIYTVIPTKGYIIHIHTYTYDVAVPPKKSGCFHGFGYIGYHDFRVFWMGTWNLNEYFMGVP